MNGLLYSQIGYDLNDPKRAIVRSTDPNYISPAAIFRVLDSTHPTAILTGPVTCWGRIWNSTWWVADFSGIRSPGEYILQIMDGDRLVEASDPIIISENRLWDATILTVALDQLEERALKARNGVGWMDCGWTWREANSHATTVIGLCDLIDFAHPFISLANQQRLVDQIVRGCDYLAILQDTAAGLGHPDGALIHELPNHPVIIPGDQAQAAVAWAHASRLIVDILPQKGRDYLARAVRAFRFLTNQCRPFGPSGFSASNHGAPPGYQPVGWMTRDLQMMLYAASELAAAGRLEFQAECAAIARQVMSRQVPEERAEDGLHGHFYTFEDHLFTEKANTHHHVGHDTGSTFPYYVLPFLEIASRWPDHPDAPAWRKTVENFAYGYFLPACSRNPFYLLPEGYFSGQGLLWFAGPWHGINTSYGFAAGMASQFEMTYGDPQFRQVAVGNLQWIAGLNAGITRQALDGCVRWRDDLPEGRAVPYSQVWGIGRRYAGGWLQIPGTICNGFDVNPQFTFTVEPTIENDEPRLFTDEDWIPHAAGWMSALARQRQRRFFKP